MTEVEHALLRSLKEHREVVVEEERWLKEREKQEKPPVVQELVLARRHLEDARMRMAIAIHMIEDENVI